MAIPARKIVNVMPRLMMPGGQELEFSGLFLTENELIPIPAVLPFSGKSAVGNFFGEDSEEYRLASQYFLGYDNSFAKPRTLYFARRINKAEPAYLRGAALTCELEDFQAITVGELKVKIDNTVIEIPEIDLSPSTSFSAVAQILQDYIQEKMPNVLVTYSSFSKGFILKSGTQGVESTVDFIPADTNLASLLNMSMEAGSFISYGSDPLTVIQNMNQIASQTENFVTYSTVYEANILEAMGLTKWSVDQMEEYLYVYWSEAPLLKAPIETESFTKKAIEENYGGATPVFGDGRYAAFIMACGASIDWNRKNGAINFAFKSQEGLAASVNDGDTADILMGKGVNIYGKYATRNDSFIFLYPGSMLGKWKFIDPYINGIWLRNALQLSLILGLKTTPRASYTAGGYALVRAWFMGPINRALNNGVIEPGVKLSETQKAELFQEAGEDISMKLWTDGYYLQILDPGAHARVNRESPVISLWYTYGGSINRLDVPATAIL